MGIEAGVNLLSVAPRMSRLGLKGNMAAYEIKRGVFGKDRVAFLCPNKQCRSPLECPLDEAGSKQQCPTCSQFFVVPGTDELERRAVAAAAEREKQAVYDRQRVEADRITNIQRDAERKLAANQRDVRREHAVQEWQAYGNWADRFLALAFSFGKYISVMVVAVCFAVIAWQLFALLMVKETPVSTQVISLKAPTAADYQQTLRRSSQHDSPNTFSSPAPGTSGSSAIDPDRQRLINLLRPIGANVVLDDYKLWYGPNRAALLTGLEKFIADVIAANPPVTEQAVAWYVAEFRRNQEMTEASEERAAEERAIARADAAARRAYNMTILGGAIATLMAFLFLPLAIQIERNTRKLYTLHTE